MTTTCCQRGACAAVPQGPDEAAVAWRAGAADGAEPQPQARTASAAATATTLHATPARRFATWDRALTPVVCPSVDERRLTAASTSRIPRDVAAQEHQVGDEQGRARVER